MRFDRDVLATVFARYPVTAAYLFGSQATGDTTPLSDVDIGVLLERDTAAPGLVRVALISDLTLVLGRDDVDVVVLNTGRRRCSRHASFPAGGCSAVGTTSNGSVSKSPRAMSSSIPNPYAACRIAT